MFAVPTNPTSTGGSTDLCQLIHDELIKEGNEAMLTSYAEALLAIKYISDQ